MHHRLARSEIARVEKKYPNPLSEQELSTCLIISAHRSARKSDDGIGNDYQIASLSNCFVIGLTGKRIRMVRLFVLTKNRYN